MCVHSLRAPLLLTLVRVAVAAGDVEASRAAHAAKAGINGVAAAPEEHGGVGSDYLKSIFYGAFDGVLTTFAIVASVQGSSLPIQVIIVTGFAKLLGDGLSMGLGDCISEQAEQTHIRGERAREAWEMEHCPEGEVRERGRGKGSPSAVATRLVPRRRCSREHPEASCR
jgi:hypothetical protein